MSTPRAQLSKPGSDEYALITRSTFTPATDCHNPANTGIHTRALNSIDEAKAGYRYAADKWSIKELVGHRLMASVCLLTARCASRVTIRRL